MALIKGEDYEVITAWRCPNCHTYYGGEKWKIGLKLGNRVGIPIPLREKLFCSRGCALEFYPNEVHDLSKEAK